MLLLRRHGELCKPLCKFSPNGRGDVRAPVSGGSGDGSYATSFLLSTVTRSSGADEGGEITVTA